MSDARYNVSGARPDNDEPREPDPAVPPDIEPSQMADELVHEMGDMAIDVIEAQIKYWTKAQEEARRQLDQSTP